MTLEQQEPAGVWVTHPAIVRPEQVGIFAVHRSELDALRHTNDINGAGATTHVATYLAAHHQLTVVVGEDVSRADR